MKSKILLIAIISVLMAFLGGCANLTAMPTADPGAALPSDTPLLTHTPQPTHTLTSTITPAPSNTAIPSNTPKPTSTVVPTPSLPQSCFDENITTQIIQNYLEQKNLESLEAGLNEFIRTTQWVDLGGSFAHLIREYPFQDLRTTMMLLGSHRISLSNVPGSKPSDFAICTYFAHPKSALIFPALTGVMMGESFQTILTLDSGLSFRNHTPEAFENWISTHIGDETDVDFYLSFLNDKELSNPKNWETFDSVVLRKQYSNFHTDITYLIEHELHDEQSMKHFIKIAGVETNYLHRFAASYQEKECFYPADCDRGAKHFTQVFSEFSQAFMPAEDIGIFATFINTNSSYKKPELDDPAEDDGQFVIYQDALADKINLETGADAEYDLENLYAPYEGKAGIRITTDNLENTNPEKFAELTLQLPANIDLNHYRWLEFYFKPNKLYEDAELLLLQVRGKELCRLHWNENVFNHDLSSALISRKGDLPNNWRRVRIPLSIVSQGRPTSGITLRFRFHSNNTGYTYLGSAKFEYERINLDLDEISLLR